MDSVEKRSWELVTLEVFEEPATVGDAGLIQGVYGGSVCQPDAQVSVPEACRPGFMSEATTHWLCKPRFPLDHPLAPKILSELHFLGLKFGFHNLFRCSFSPENVGCTRSDAHVVSVFHCLIFFIIPRDLPPVPLRNSRSQAQLSIGSVPQVPRFDFDHRLCISF